MEDVVAAGQNGVRSADRSEGGRNGHQPKLSRKTVAVMTYPKRRNVGGYVRRGYVRSD